MEARILGCAGTVSPESKTSAFLINDSLLLDGGTICSALSLEEIGRLETVFISHPHFDHIKGIPSLAETLIFMGAERPVTIMGSAQALESLQNHIMNDIIWPDFSRLPSVNKPVINYHALAERSPVTIGTVTVTPFLLNSNLTDFGYLVEEGEASLFYTSDIGADAQLASKNLAPKAIIIEVSFPNEEEELARQTGHLTPLLLLKMLKTLPRLPGSIYISHLKTYYRERIVRQLTQLGLANLVILSDGDLLQL
jgi:cAMP phosphodiesterase